MRGFELFLDVFNQVVLGYFVLINLFYFGTSMIAFWALRRQNVRMEAIGAAELISAAGAPPITLIAPTFNEEATCVEATRSLLALEYPAYEIVVVNDGSTDTTLDRMIRAFEFVPAARAPMATLETRAVRAVYRSRRHPDLWMVDKVNGGKADALNVGLNFCRSPFFCAMDADSLLERDALDRIVRPFLEDERTIATGGLVRVGNDCDVRSGRIEKVRLPSRPVAAFQVLEYLRAFLSGRMGWGALGCTLIISGAFGLFRRGTVIDAGGFCSDTVGEDMELVVRLHRHCREKKIPYKISFVPDPVAWTEVPETLSVLSKQRDRWQRGLTDSLVRHRKMLLNPRYGRIGLVAFPFYVIFEMLGPIIEILGYITFVIAFLLGRLSPAFALSFFLLAFVFGVTLSIAAVAQEELTFRRYPRLRDVLTLFLIGIIENFGYRQLTTLWRARGLVSALRRRKDWGAMKRKGFTAAQRA